MRHGEIQSCRGRLIKPKTSGFKKLKGDYGRNVTTGKTVICQKKLRRRGGNG
ncbi:hypothetical protein DPMN_031279 [Dreissena polymorpha]|uniref:Uncharacterized protein n=1 Tax=Dreissena polymorpha TaxID=45954 RepID=A0A9D4RH63_DREPO|nr:hypothetical protein DPMN_031279 [Dreissena polymorpha]